MNADDDAIRTLTDAQCWEFLERSRFGRLAVAPAGRIDVFPLNFVARDGRITFRTAEGTKLLSLTVNAAVALEADEVTGGQARSVVVHGTARTLETTAEIDAAESLPLRSWIPTRKTRFVQITPTELTGRAFHLGRESDAD
ncbi:pyridoxamine 5-phosphate oxidase [Tersicoccus phoenicis]|uniref:Pyridoxamine 5-phosphate oxidase n=1 Tax=Tersicoccus phoenicis TaxID=554083 RepID=A0A1R1LHH7_9MICC|nr:pyridoxamine 5'-phosphate oxidase family protein [Tersicoccus phoenicis]OMH26966.1 pyridoxamine 5-phosphate oxidase [Tersicoccus phoenicis]